MDNLRSIRDYEMQTIGPHTSPHSGHDSPPLPRILVSRPIHQRSISLNVDVYGHRRHASSISGGTDEQAIHFLLDILPRITSATPAVLHKHDHAEPPAHGQSAWSTATHISPTATSYAFGTMPTARNRTRTLDSIPPRVRALSPASYERAAPKDSGIVPCIPKVRSWPNLLLETQSGPDSSLRGGVYGGENATGNRIAHTEGEQASGNGGRALDHLRNPASNAGEVDTEASIKHQKHIPEGLSALPSQDQGETKSPQDPPFISIQGRLDMLMGCRYGWTEPPIHSITAELPNDTKIRSKVEQLQHTVHQLGLEISSGYVIEWGCDEYLKEVVRYPGTIMRSSFLI
jgi:hypothetical protein